MSGKRFFFTLLFDRLITGGRDGRLRIWNYNNGHCLRTLEKSKTWLMLSLNRKIALSSFQVCPKCSQVFFFAAFGVLKIALATKTSLFK